MQLCLVVLLTARFVCGTGGIRSKCIDYSFFIDEYSCARTHGYPLRVCTSAGTSEAISLNVSYIQSGELYEYLVTHPYKLYFINSSNDAICNVRLLLAGYCFTLAVSLSEDIYQTCERDQILWAHVWNCLYLHSPYRFIQNACVSGRQVPLA